MNLFRDFNKNLHPSSFEGLVESGSFDSTSEVPVSLTLSQSVLLEAAAIPCHVIPTAFKSNIVHLVLLLLNVLIFFKLDSDLEAQVLG